MTAGPLAIAPVVRPSKIRLEQRHTFLPIHRRLALPVPPLRGSRRLITALVLRRLESHLNPLLVRTEAPYTEALVDGARKGATVCRFSQRCRAIERTALRVVMLLHVRLLMMRLMLGAMALFLIAVADAHHLPQVVIGMLMV